MDAREEILKDVLAIDKPNMFLELATGTGKSSLAIKKVQQLYPEEAKILIVVPRNVLKGNWKDEIDKWWKDCPLDITYTTYVSFPKHAGKWDCIIFDECQHLTERCMDALNGFAFKNSILLSATVGRNLKSTIKYRFRPIDCYSIGLRNAIDEGILPDPKVFLIPLHLDNSKPTESIWKNRSAKGRLIECSWVERWQYIRQKACPVRIYCTQAQYVSDLDSQIDWWKRNFKRTGNPGVKNRWLFLCGERLKYLSNLKNDIVYRILKRFKDNRTLTFCGSIEQTEILGRYCINSKNKKSIEYYNSFNEGRIKHITACNILNEGMNLRNCQIGIFANLNNSEIIVNQRVGRILRHKNPIIIIPYYKGTREEELVEKMLENYNKELITVINDIKEMKLT